MRSQWPSTRSTKSRKITEICSHRIAVQIWNENELVVGRAHIRLRKQMFIETGKCTQTEISKPTAVSTTNCMKSHTEGIIELFAVHLKWCRQGWCWRRNINRCQRMVHVATIQSVLRARHSLEESFLLSCPLSESHFGSKLKS